MPRNDKTLPGPAPGPSDLPAPRGGGAAHGGGARSEDLIDLPAPRARQPISDLPAPRSPTAAGVAAARNPAELDLDLPAPKGFLDDLPAPAARGGATTARNPPAVDLDRPAPRGASGGPGPAAISAAELDLPAPRGVARGGAPARNPAELDLDLPAPKGFLDDVPAPRPAAPRPAAPRPAAPDLDLPAPKGFLDDVPAPRPAAPGPAAPDLDLPAPKGFLDDIPAPRPGPGIDLPAPKGFLDDAPVPAPRVGPGGIDLPAPKGFLDDDPVPAPRVGPGGIDLPAPKGFLDDLPVPAPRGTAGARAPAPLDLGTAGAAPPAADFAELSLEPDTPAAASSAVGLGLDFARGPTAAAPAAAAPFGLGLDAAPNGDFSDLEAGLAPPGSAVGGADSFAPLELDGAASAAPGGFPDLGLDLGSSQLGAAPEPNGGFGSLGLDLGSSQLGAAPEPGHPEPAFADLELRAPQPRAPAAGLDIELEPPSTTPASSASFLTFSAGAAAKTPPAALEVEREEPPPAAADQEATRPAPARERAPRRAAAAGPGRRRRKGAVAAAAFGVLLLGGGATGYWHYTQTQERAARVTEGIAKARSLLQRSEPGHWQQAAQAAERVLQLAENDATAMALAAQAYFAAVIDEGGQRDATQAKGAKLMEQIRATAAVGSDVDKADGLRALAEREPGQAIERLRGVLARKASDADAQLYLGWAHAASQEPDKAITAFRAALQGTPARVAALYGLGRALAAVGEAEAARKAFLEVIERNRNHIGALVGVAQLVEAVRYDERERRYLEILERKDLDSADPRAVSQAWTLAGDEALRARRIEEAAQRYGRALDRDPHNLDARVGAARAELAQQHLEPASEKLTAVLKVAPTHVGALITAAELAQQRGQSEAALAQLEQVIGRQPPLKNRTELMRAHLVRASVYAADPAQQAAAEREFRAAIEQSSDGEIGPIIAFASFLANQGRAADALAQLKPIESAAGGDAVLAVTLGLAYAKSADYTSAERWFRTALDLRPRDPEAQFQLGLALLGQKRVNDAIEAIKAAFREDPQREDIGLGLAMIYEENGRTADASTVYGQLLQRAEPSVNARARAGRFFARTGELQKAAEQGRAILAVQGRNAAGLYLQGEGLLADGQPQAAQKSFREATTIDPQAQYLEALGRSSEQLGEMDEALGAFRRATEVDPRFLQPLIGAFRVHFARRAHKEALAELTRALALAPDDPLVHAGIGDCHLAMGNNRDAVRSLTLAARLDGNRASVHYSLGRAYYELDKPRDAAGALGAAVRLARGKEPWLTEAYRLLGYAERTRGGRAAAISAWREYLARAPEQSAEVMDVKRLLLRLEAR
jgi:tetratricopeptide (TPR) repeat protein